MASRFQSTPFNCPDNPEVVKYKADADWSFPQVLLLGKQGVPRQRFILNPSSKGAIDEVPKGMSSQCNLSWQKKKWTNKHEIPQNPHNQATKDRQAMKTVLGYKTQRSFLIKNMGKSTEAKRCTYLKMSFQIIENTRRKL